MSTINQLSKPDQQITRLIVMRASKCLVNSPLNKPAIESEVVAAMHGIGRRCMVATDSNGVALVEVY